LTSLRVDQRATRLTAGWFVTELASLYVFMRYMHINEPQTKILNSEHLNKQGKKHQ